MAVYKNWDDCLENRDGCTKTERLSIEHCVDCDCFYFCESRVKDFALG